MKTEIETQKVQVDLAYSLYISLKRGLEIMQRESKKPKFDAPSKHLLKRLKKAS